MNNDDDVTTSTSSKDRAALRMGLYVRVRALLPLEAGQQSVLSVIGVWLCCRTYSQQNSTLMFHNELHEEYAACFDHVFD